MHALYALCLFGLPLACARADGQPRQPRKTSAAEGPLVLELFTSQGCSSCPPADRLLSKIASAGSLADRAVAPLSFHVDYWNDLGWTDPYSLPAWTERQRQYARAIDENRIYTPELVIGGASGVIGSDQAAVTQAIQRAPRPALLAATAAWSKDAVTITTTAPSDADVWVAVWEDGTSTKVTRGENSGETLGNDRVVRRLERVTAAGQQASITVPIDPAWHAAGAVAFAQRPDRRIVASVLLPR
ncbi:MAG TPA: DUF1223 domain-containing protein [Kofleriaceae bacterium]|jgi:hypothetical protein|nr:DUF1223 domain-containing protein [Kofleriaceae bacterium]